jgi:hypothetical protein
MHATDARATQNNPVLSHAQILPDPVILLSKKGTASAGDASEGDVHPQGPLPDGTVLHNASAITPKGAEAYLSTSSIEADASSLPPRRAEYRLQMDPANHLAVPDEDWSYDFGSDELSVYGLDELLGLKKATGIQNVCSTMLRQPEPRPDIAVNFPLPIFLAHADHRRRSGPKSPPRLEFVSQQIIRDLFESSTFDILSIKEDRNKNPWRTLVWPMAAECPALYHALAAMACFHVCQIQPQLRAPALLHFEQSFSALTKSDQFPLAMIIATKLALALAASWDHERSASVIEHTRSARSLIRQFVASEDAMKLSRFDLSRISFLANTCLYMDVIARVICTDPESANDEAFNSACSLLSSPIPRKQQFDPLMGCAITLFPLIGRLAELVGCIRPREKNCNPPSIVSRGMELKVAIERWAPPLDLESAADLRATLIDSIQTAEAYRWASLLLLSQAVSELPWRHSSWEMASKCLVYLATIPLTSRTTIVQTFPLMIAGCEASNDEDRDWVRQRWNRMSKRMISGIVERCRKVTTEVWRRRDEYGSRVTSRRDAGDSPSLAAASRQTISDNGVPEALDRFAGLSGPSAGNETNLPACPRAMTFEDELGCCSTAGHYQCTVRNDLHFLKVMQDWNWPGEIEILINSMPVTTLTPGSISRLTSSKSRLK